MSDENNGTPDIVPGRVRIHRATDKPDKYDERGKRRPGSKMGDLFTREDAMEYLAEASLAVGQKVYDQLAQETAALLEQMERAVAQHVIEYFESRTLRGRFRRWLRRVRGQGPTLVKDETPALEVVSDETVEQAPAELSEEAIESARQRVVEAQRDG